MSRGDEEHVDLEGFMAGVERRNPGQSGGLPQLWLRPPPHDQSIDVGGIKIDTEDHSQPAPQGYWTTP